MGFQRFVWLFLFLSWSAVAVSRLVWRRPAPVCCPATHSSRDPPTGDLISTSERERDTRPSRERERERVEREREGEETRRDEKRKRRRGEEEKRRRGEEEKRRRGEESTSVTALCPTLSPRPADCGMLVFRVLPENAGFKLEVRSVVAKATTSVVVKLARDRHVGVRCCVSAWCPTDHVVRRPCWGASTDEVFALHTEMCT